MWRNTTYKRITDFDRLGLLLWKNYLLVTRTKTKVLALIAVPVLFTLIFLLIKILMADVETDHRSYTGMSILTAPSRSVGSHLTFVANNFKGAPALMREIERVLKLNKSMEFYSDPDMERYLQAAQKNRGIGGIVFRKNGSQLVAVIRVGGQTTPLTSSQHVWHTKHLYPWLVEVSSRFYDSGQGGSEPGYVQTGFMAIQSAISMAYLRQNGDLKEVPEIHLRRFPHPPHTVPRSLHVTKIVLSVGTLIGFYFICLYNVKSIVLEKEMQFKEAMKMMGLGDFLHWCAWFIEFVVIFMVMSIVMICGWKISNVFAYSNVGILIAVFLAYGVAFSTFCFMLSSIFSNSATATIFVLLIWCVSFVPYYLTWNDRLIHKYLAGLSLNTAMFFFIDILYNREALEEGVKPQNFSEPVWFEHNVSVADCVYMLLIDFFLYSLIAWYLNKVFPGPYGIPARWYFPFEGCFRLNKNIRPVYGTFESGANYENGPEGKQPSIKVVGLTKIYSNATVGLDGITMNIFDNEITVLLGENGAGKSTLLSVLTGLYPPTNGTAIISDFDIRSHMDLIHESLGVCPQHNILFNLLTVEEHLVFFSKLKGCRMAEARYEASKYITQLDMREKAEALVETISMGMKRRLCLAIALCGDSKVILADEPTTGMDPIARKAVWDLLQVEKSTRIIVMSTHNMEEADVLADRVAILQSGKLKCYGSPKFLKNLYGGAKFKLSFEKNENSDIPGITETVKRYIPTAVVSMNMASELTYNLDEGYRLKFPLLLTDIENNAARLGLQGYGISLTGMEEVFFRVLLDNPEYAQNVDGQRIMNPADGIRESSSFQSKIIGLLLKKCLYTKYHWLVILVQLLIPPLVIYVMLRTITDPSEKYRIERPLEISLDAYKNDPICIITPLTTRLGEEYAVNFNDPPVPRMLVVEENISEFFLNRMKDSDVPFIHMRYLVGVSLNERPMVAWYNNQPYHTIPLTIDVLFGAMLRLICGNCSLRIVNHPLPEFKGVASKISESNLQDAIGEILVIVIVDLTMYIMVAYFGIDCVTEQRSRMKLMQYISGISPMLYWLATTIFDLLLVLLTVGLVVAVYMAEVKPENSCVNFPLILVAYAFSVLPLIYIRSLRYSNPSAAYLNIVMLGFFLGTLCHFGWSKGAPYIPVSGYWKNMTRTVMQVIPFFNLAYNMEHVWISHDEKRSDWSAAGLTEFSLSWNLGLFAGSGLLVFLLLVLSESNFWWLLSYTLFRRQMGNTNDASMDPDVIKERDYVATMGPSNVAVLNLVFQKLCKSYDHQLAVNDLSLTVEGFQCFGLLGANGAGKTTLFKMLTGDAKISSGEAFICGLSVKRDLRSIYLAIGYCPQEEALPEDLTGRQTLKIFCLLKGISTDVVDQVSLEIAHNLGFLSHIDKRVKELSGGNRRKLSVALAMLNRPRVLLMDEPTSGLDPSAKRQMWRMISSHKEFGKSILFSSQSMEECEVLCTRLSIMVNGELKCIGTTQHLKARFADGYLLMIHIDRARANLMEPGSDVRIHKVEEYIYNTFPGAILQQNYQGRLYYHIPFMRGMRWSVMFTKLESIRSTLEIESYNIRQLGLDHVFRKFTQSQLQDLRLQQ